MMVVFNSRIRLGQSEGSMSSADHVVNPPRPRGRTGVVVTREEYRLPLDEWNYQVSQFITRMCLITQRAFRKRKK